MDGNNSNQEDSSCSTCLTDPKTNDPTLECNQNATSEIDLLMRPEQQDDNCGVEDDILSTLWICFKDNDFHQAEDIFKSADNRFVDRLVSCYDTSHQTLLHVVKSAKLADLLLSFLPANRKQQYIRRCDAIGWTAAHCSLLSNHTDVFQEIWRHSDNITRSHFLTYRDRNGYSVLMEAGYQGNREALRLLIEVLIGCKDPEAIIGLINMSGETVIYPLVVWQYIDEVADILKAVPLDHRRRLILAGNVWGYSPYQLSLISPYEVRCQREQHLDIYYDFNRSFEKTSNNLISALHMLCNDYDILSRASIIQCELTSDVSGYKSSNQVTTLTFIII